MSGSENRPLRLAVLGGTFDPIHTGHMMIAKTFLRRLEPDKLLLIPTRTPPHKGTAQTDARHRFNMCVLAAGELGEVCEASDIELLREGKSYSIDTVRELLCRYPGAEIFLIVGADMFMSLETWYRAQELFKLATFCTVARDGVDTDRLTEYSKHLETLGARCIIEPFEPVDISSTQLRIAAKSGNIPKNAVCKPVLDYIKANKLYI